MTGRTDGRMDEWMDGWSQRGGGESLLRVYGGFFLMASHFIHKAPSGGGDRLQRRFIHAAPTQINTGQSEQRGGRVPPAIT